MAFGQQRTSVGFGAARETEECKVKMSVSGRVTASMENIGLAGMLHLHIKTRTSGYWVQSCQCTNVEDQYNDSGQIQGDETPPGNVGELGDGPNSNWHCYLHNMPRCCDSRTSETGGHPHHKYSSGDPNDVDWVKVFHCYTYFSPKRGSCDGEDGSFWNPHLCSGGRSGLLTVHCGLWSNPLLGTGGGPWDPGSHWDLDEDCVNSLFLTWDQVKEFLAWGLCQQEGSPGSSSYEDCISHIEDCTLDEPVYEGQPPEEHEDPLRAIECYTRKKSHGSTDSGTGQEVWTTGDTLNELEEWLSGDDAETLNGCECFEKMKECAVRMYPPSDLDCGFSQPPPRPY